MRICISILLLTMLALSIVVVPVVAQPPGQRGPRIDTLRWNVLRSPAVQSFSMTVGPPIGSDTWVTSCSRQPWASTEMPQASAYGGITPAHWPLGTAIVNRERGFHMGLFGFNYRRHPLDDVNFRHALAHLVPKTSLILNLFAWAPADSTVATLDSPMPPTHALWCNPNADPHPYSPNEAEDILAAAGYQEVGGVWKDTDGSDLPDVKIYTPLEIVAPTSLTICRTLDEEAEAIGLTNLVLEPMDFSTYVDLVFNKQDFDMFWLCYDLGRFPTHLWSMFHEENHYLGGENCYGIHYPELDALLDILWRSFDHTAKILATHRAQELLMGGSDVDPLPDYVPPWEPRSQAIPIVPVYSRGAWDALDPYLRGAVNMFGYATNNMWSWMNIHWNTPDEHRPGTTERTVVAILDDFPKRLNPLSARTSCAWTFIDSTLDGLIATNPYTHRDEPWLATSWSYVAVPGGMNVTFNLRLTDSQGQPVRWQDGAPISVDDVKFAWDFLHEWEIPRYRSTFRYYDPITTVIVNSATIRVRVTTTSQWLLYALAGAAYMLPPPVWTSNPVTGDPWTSTTEILVFDPSAYAGPNGLPTMLYGTGPFMLTHSKTFIGVNGYGDLAANRNYWLTTRDIEDKLIYMFWRVGDVNKNGFVDAVGDLVEIAIRYLTTPGDPWWSPDADITGIGGSPPDSVIDIWDFSQGARFFGETRTVP